MPPGGKERWSDIPNGHELYNVGHLYEAAIAYYEATGKRRLLDVALKNANLICATFGPGQRTDPPGHQQIEIGLARLYRVTGEEKYLRQAKFFLDARGRREGRAHLYGEYSQDHKPVVEQEEAVGHAVRAAYMYTGMADVAALTGAPAYVQAIRRIWDDVVNRKLYVTGGLGAAGGHEGFGAEYFLPNRTAYCETCASVASAMWNHRMFLWTGESRFMDLVEQVLYNAFLSGISMAGESFFYPNRLESFRGERRQPWFACACCPANIVRFVPSIPGYAYANTADTVFVNLFIGSEAKLDLGGTAVLIRQRTRYPWDGRIQLTLQPASAKEFTLKVRLPAWLGDRPVPGTLYAYLGAQPDAASTIGAVTLNGQAFPGGTAVDGYLTLQRPWKAGDTVELELPMPVRRVVASERVEANRGRVAVQRGPLVYCAEGLDQPDPRVQYLRLPDTAALAAQARPELLGGVTVVRGQAGLVARERDGGKQSEPLQDLTLIPYYAQAHRERTPMTVWLAREFERARALPAPTLAYTSQVKASRGTDLEALNDQLSANSSDDHTNPFFHWWPRRANQEWVEYHFPQPARVFAVEVYWLDDRGGCRLPKGWRLLARVGGEWVAVSNPSGYGVVGDRFNVCNFDPVETVALRLEVDMPERAAAGIHEWVVRGETLNGARPD
ncbi:MAG: glycoside hydrolase family 127 protein [Verrucomicrobia bacterium]|nr:glycoside hydrolase family 127 protein [Verrucomicrobiota bacterium]